MLLRFSPEQGFEENGLLMDFQAEDAAGVPAGCMGIPGRSVQAWRGEEICGKTACASESGYGRYGKETPEMYQSGTHGASLQRREGEEAVAVNSGAGKGRKACSGAGEPCNRGTDPALSACPVQHGLSPAAGRSRRPGNGTSGRETRAEPWQIHSRRGGGSAPPCYGCIF